MNESAKTDHSEVDCVHTNHRYQCQLVQAIVLKQIYEARRAQNAFGHLVWMLNEIWPTVGWGSLEYGPPPGFTPGQVRGGR